ncbi:MAG: hypothetical protein WC315_08755 [Candidatus Omnitrophota bacterium]|jgi:hypothetical protein
MRPKWKQIAIDERAKLIHSVQNEIRWDIADSWKEAGPQEKDESRKKAIKELTQELNHAN